MSVDAGKNPSSFDAYAGNYEAALAQGLSLSGENRDFFARRRVELLTQRLLALNVQPASIMDFGCGDGSSTPNLLNIPGAKQILGTDLSADSIKLAEQRFSRPNIKFQTLNEHLAESTFDLVFSNGVFHHIPPVERPAAITKIYNALRPGGLFALWENNPWNPGTRLVMSRIPFDRDANTLTYRRTNRLLRAGRFEIITTHFAFYFPRPLASLRFLETFLTKIPLGAQYLLLGRKT